MVTLILVNLGFVRTTSASQQVPQRNDFWLQDNFKNQGPRENQFLVKSTPWESNFTPSPWAPTHPPPSCDVHLQKEGPCQHGRNIFFKAWRRCQRKRWRCVASWESVKPLRLCFVPPAIFIAASWDAATRSTLWIQQYLCLCQLSVCVFFPPCCQLLPNL